jgi:DNA-binding NarL/FixJ family response regulator
MKPLRIVLADDHDVVVEGLRRILDRPEFDVVKAVGNGRALVQAAEDLRPDLIIADVSMPQLNGIEAARQIRRTNANVKIIFLTMHPDVSYATEGLAAGGNAYVLKSAAGEELLMAIRAVEAGRVYVIPSIAEAVRNALAQRSRRKAESAGPVTHLTPRQREVLQLLAEGHHAKEVAALLNVSPRTVEFHKYRIMEQLGLHTVAELTLYAAKHGIVAA